MGKDSQLRKSGLYPRSLKALKSLEVRWASSKESPTAVPAYEVSKDKVLDFITLAHSEHIGVLIASRAGLDTSNFLVA